MTNTEDRFRNLVESIPDIVYRLDAGGNFTFVNAAVRSLGYEPADLIGKHFSVLIHPDDLSRVSRDAVLPEFRGVITGPESQPKLFNERRTGNRATRGLWVRLVKRDRQEVMDASVFSHGEILSTGQYDKPIHDKDKKLVGTVGIIRDITELKISREKERALQEQLLQSEKMRALGEILSGAAHELNNPLTAILGYAQLMMSAKRLEECEGDLKAICAEAKRCSTIVQSLVAFARKKGHRREACNVNQIVRDTLKMRAYQMTIDGIITIVNLDDRISNIMADATQLQQVFLNLVNNAVAAMEKSERKRLAVTSRLQTETVHVMFQDSGVGIPREDLHRVFEPFYTTKDIGKGTGLGLSVCYGIVSEHGGRIWAESDGGMGATFHVELPAIPPPIVLAYESGEGAPEARRGGGEEILVVDDEESLRDVIKRYLEQKGYVARAAGTVDEALDRIGRHSNLRLIISDHKMPGKSGEDLYQYIKDKRPDLLDRFVLVSGDVLNASTARFIKDTGVRVIEKPFDLGRLGDIVSDMMHPKEDRPN